MKPLTVPGVLDSLSAIRQYVAEAAKAAELDRKASYRLQLAVDEIATNIIVHGYAEAGITGEVNVSASIGDDTLTVALEDTAEEFDPRTLATPDNLDAPLEERPIGGLGIYLTLQGVDEFRYERVGGQNRNIFIMRRNRFR